QRRFASPPGLWLDDDGFKCPEAQARAEAWFEANRPLPDNEIVSRTGKRGVMSVDGEWLRIAWADGSKSKHHWTDLVGKPDAEWVRRRTFYEANAPKNPTPGPITDTSGECVGWRFDSGREVTFKMRDDGEAKFVGSDSPPPWTTGEALYNPAMYPWCFALLDF